MQAALVSRLQPGTDLGDSGLEVLENGGLLTARMPAVLVEPVFLSNPRKPRASPTRVGNGWRRLRRRWPRASMPGCDRSGLGRSDNWRQWPVPGAFMTAEDPLLAAPRGSAARALVSALQAEARRPERCGLNVTEVYRLAPLVGLDPAIVIAQSAHETGWWQSPAWTDHLNPAGIGITGADVASPSWESGGRRRAHLVHLFSTRPGRFHPAIPWSPTSHSIPATTRRWRRGEHTAPAAWRI